MRLSPTVLTNRFRAVADRLARGSAVPAGTDPADQEHVGKRPGSRERGAMRRRLRQRRKLRDALLMELGALVMEAHRHGRDDAGVVKSKATEVAAVDAETVALAEELNEGGDVARLSTTGLAAPCHACGALVSTRARFCEHCGTDLGARPEPEAPVADSTAVEEAPAGEPPVAEQPAGANGDEPTTVIETEQEPAR